MSYKALVYALGPVVPHPNADRVRLTSVQGLQVVVGLDAREGDLGVYFPSDGQLSHEFCAANNLYRERTMNADPAANPGMFDANRRVRAQRFRGELSDGFWLPVSSLVAVGADASTLPPHGKEIDEVGGRELCRKYVNEATLRAASGGATKKQRTARSSPMFKEHFDTPHVGRDLSKIGQDSVLYVTEKLHGCVRHDTVVETLERGPLKIKEVVDGRLDVHVKAFDVETGEIVFAHVDAHYHVADDGEWFEVELEDGTIITITGNNPVWLPDLCCYRRVDQLVIGDVLLTDEVHTENMQFSDDLQRMR